MNLPQLTLTSTLALLVAGSGNAQVPVRPVIVAPAQPVPGTAPAPTTAAGAPATAAQGPGAPATQGPTAQAPGALPPGVQGPPPPPADAAQAKAQEAQQKQQRMQKLQQIQFDRRPSTILRVWATPPEPEGDAKTKSAQKDPAAAAGEQVPAQGDAPETVVESAQEMIVEAAAIEIPEGAPAELVAAMMQAQAMAGGAPGQPAKPPKDPFDRALFDWQRSVTLGDWPAVKQFLAGLGSDEEKKAAWMKLITGLRNPPPPQNQQHQPFGFEQNQISFDDLLGIAAAAPVPLDDPALTALGGLLQVALGRGHQIELLVQRLQAEVARPEAERVLQPRHAVKLLSGAGQILEAGLFLPTLDQAIEQKDHEALNLIARRCLAQHQKEPKTEFLEQAWAALQGIFAADQIDQAQKAQALTAAVGLAPRLRAELGKAWLDASFARQPQRGMDILSQIGITSAQTVHNAPGNTDLRLKTLQLQSTAVNALLAAAPERAAEWRPQLSLLAQNWLREAQIAYQHDRSTQFGPRLNRDRFGNFYYWDEDGNFVSNQTGGMSLKTADLLDIRPEAPWLALVDEPLRPKFAMVFAQLWLKVQEEAIAFPHIAELAATHPRQAKELVDEFLRVWTKNHDPNSSRNRNNYFFYGYEPRAEGIPLTRSKQQRNLAELAEWVGKLRTLPIGELNVELLAQAFTTCHSTAEVYQQEAIEQVFGSVAELQPKTLAQLAEGMRANLGTLWRRPAEQEKNRTRRKQKDIEAEVLRGYEVARTVLSDALRKHPREWSLVLATANLAHDENNYRRELGRSAEFAGRREDALADYERAADLYAATVGTVSADEETTQVYEHWLYAALGAADLPNVSQDTVPDLREVPKIREHLFGLPGEAAERHVAKFAGTMFARMGSANPAVKFRYLKAGFDIVGDHKLAREARQVFDYYRDLVTEIRLEAAVDGSDAVGHEQPFGLFVNIRHTREIERESGGFGRYLQNQNNANYSYNYGRPTENYRDKFQEAAQKALAEHFEVLSVTFQADTVHSRALPDYGWRYTPYAYLLLKPRGPQVDRIPPLRLDLDFLDTSGYAVLPIETAAVPIDASARTSPPPASNLEITQILDERQAKDGKLVLEVKITGRGLVPGIDQLLDLASPGFEIQKLDDSGVSVARFDPEAEDNAVQSERTVMVTMHARPDLERLPTKFHFGTVKVADAKVLHQRYADADLVGVGAEVDLLAAYGETRSRWPWYLGLGAVLLLALGAVFTWRRRRGTVVVATGLRLPERITPFTVLGLLQQLQHDPALDAAGRAELADTIAQLEAHFFSEERNGTAAPDLRSVAQNWLARAGVRPPV